MGTLNAQNNGPLYSKEGTGRGRSPPSPLLAVPNVAA